MQIIKRHSVLFREFASHFFDPLSVRVFKPLSLFDFLLSLAAKHILYSMVLFFSKPRKEALLQCLVSTKLVVEVFDSCFCCSLLRSLLIFKLSHELCSCVCVVFFFCLHTEDSCFFRAHLLGLCNLANFALKELSLFVGVEPFF